MAMKMIDDVYLAGGRYINCKNKKDENQISMNGFVNSFCFL